MKSFLKTMSQKKIYNNVKFCFFLCFFASFDYFFPLWRTRIYVLLRHHYVVMSDMRYAIVVYGVTVRGALMAAIQRQLERYYRSVEST